jgi:hypothetical protein
LFKRQPSSPSWLFGQLGQKMFKKKYSKWAGRHISLFRAAALKYRLHLAARVFIIDMLQHTYRTLRLRVNDKANQLEARGAFYPRGLYFR